MIEIIYNPPQTFSISLAGPQGPAGTAGANGQDGVDGVNGTNGTNGTNGATWLSGSGTPNTSFGLVNDFYLDVASSNVYKKTGVSTWSLQLNIKGATGAAGTNGTNGTNGAAGANGVDGSKWLSGTTVPSGATGSVGDWYLHTVTYDVYLKTGASTWTVQLNIKGPQGIQGVAGTNGTNGVDGQDGAPGIDGGDYPWVFNVLEYGAVGNGRMIRDGAITSGTNILDCTTTTPFTSGDVGKYVMIKGAASNPQTTLIATITGFTNSGRVTISTNAVTTVSNALVMFGTDDTIAIQAAIDAAVDYAQAGSGNATVLIPPAPGMFYAIAGALKTNRNGNSQLNFEVIPSTVNKVSISIESYGSGSAVQHWEQLYPTLSGATLVSFGVFASSGAQTSNINAGGNPAVIGGPSQPGGYGVSPGIFSNMYVSLKGISILTTYSFHGLTYTAFDFSGIANAKIESIAYGTTGIVSSGDYGTSSSFANGLSVGALMPAAGNNDNCIVRDVTIHGGYTYAFFATEHCVIDTMRILYCWSGFCPVGNYYGSVGATHAIKAQQLSIESCSNVVYVIGVGSAGIGPFIDIDQLDTESGVTSFSDNVSGNALRAALGTIKLTGLFTPANVVVSAPTGLKIIDGQRAFPVLTKTTNYTCIVTDDTIIGDATAGDITITLHSPLYTPNTFTIHKSDATANSVFVDTGAGTVELATQGETAKFIPVSGAWVRII
jgi:hypothetical protein